MSKPKKSKPTPYKPTPYPDQLYLIDFQIRDLQNSRAELLDLMEAEYWPTLRDRLRKKHSQPAARKRG